MLHDGFVCYVCRLCEQLIIGQGWIIAPGVKGNPVSSLPRTSDFIGLWWKRWIQGPLLWLCKSNCCVSIHQTMASFFFCCFFFLLFRSIVERFRVFCFRESKGDHIQLMESYLVLVTANSLNWPRKCYSWIHCSLVRPGWALQPTSRTSCCR